MQKAARGGLVYSTDGGRMCPVCRRPIAACACAALAALPLPGGGVVRVNRERRGGKVVTLVRGVPLDPAALAALGQRLRRGCGAGGTVKDGVIEVQGDHAERVVEALNAEGYAVKRAGG
jgi:translation initiation factor 1